MVFKIIRPQDICDHLGKWLMVKKQHPQNSPRVYSDTCKYKKNCPNNKRAWSMINGGIDGANVKSLPLVKDQGDVKISPCFLTIDHSEICQSALQNQTMADYRRCCLPCLWTSAKKSKSELGNKKCNIFSLWCQDRLLVE